MKQEKYELFGVNLANVRNVWETRLIKHMNEILPEFEEFDYCSICIQDVYALAMNHLTPKYIQQGTVQLKKEQSDNNLRDIIEMAVIQVLNNPNHQ